jgi:hypothetical protein
VITERPDGQAAGEEAVSNPAVVTSAHLCSDSKESELNVGGALTSCLASKGFAPK